MRPRSSAIRIVLFGAHPDDCEINAGATAALWAKTGFAILLVSMTNGDIGHHAMAGGPLARRRAEESRRSAKVARVSSLVLDNHDGELLPTLDNRKRVVKIIREFKADAVITHRPNDYHPDHRYTAQILQDAAYMVTVPAFCPDIPALRENPVFLYFSDRFEKPCPFSPDVAVIVDRAMDIKWRMLDSMDSQVYEWLPWHDGQLDDVPAGPKARLKWLKKRWDPGFRAYTKKGRTALTKWYGKAEASKAEYAEFFEICEYGTQPTEAELRKLFPFFPKKGRAGK